MNINNYQEELVSIIVPCYNQAQYLPDCLDSIISQSYSYWECIIVDDGSPDDTEEIAALYCKKDKRISYLKKKNGGPSAARNAGIAKSKGVYILPIDADDKITEDYLQLAVEAFNNNSNLILVYSWYQYFGLRSSVNNTNDFIYNRFIYCNSDGVFSACVYKHSEYDKIGGYDENMKELFEDWEFLLRLIHSDNEVYRIPKVCFYYRIKDVSRNTVSWTNNDKRNRALQYIYQKNSHLYNSLDNNPLVAYQRVEDEIFLSTQKVRSSLAYRVGNTIIRPLRFIQKIMHPNK